MKRDAKIAVKPDEVQQVVSATITAFLDNPEGPAWNLSMRYRGVVYSTRPLSIRLERSGAG